MEFLVFWFGTVLCSVCLRTVQSFSLYKDLADNGYKFNKELENNITTDDIQYDFSSLKMLIPLYNIFNELNGMMWYTNHRFILVDELRMQDKVVEMTPFEKEKYQKNPTYLNAFLVPLEYEARIHGANHIKYSDDFRKGTIYYDFEDKKGDLTILNATGNLEGLSDEQKKEIIANKYREVIIKALKEREGLTEKERLLELKEELLKIKGKESEEEQEVKTLKKKK